LKKVLLLIPQNIIPVTDGGKAGLFYPMCLLAKHFEVKAFVFINKNEAVNEVAYKELQVDVQFLSVHKKDTPLNIISNIFYKLPFKFKKYYTQKHQQTIENTCINWQPEIIICHHAHLAAYCNNIKQLLPNVQLLLREHNIEYLLVYQYYQLNKNVLAKAIAYWQYLKTKAIEEKSWNLFDKVLFISDTDYALVPAAIQQTNGIVLYDGGSVHIDTSVSKKPYFLFTGKVTVLQNQKNLENFIFNIWIPWKKRYNTNGYELWITGSKLAEFKKYIAIADEDLKKYSIVIKGFVDDLVLTVQEASFFVSPTIIGAGIRIKVLEALCMGSVIFLTSIDLKMVNCFKNLENVVHYETIEDFNQQFQLLTSNAMLYHQIQTNAITTAKEQLSWDVYFKQLNFILQPKD
jgi:hypothetical protein